MEGKHEGKQLIIIVQQSSNKTISNL